MKHLRKFDSVSEMNTALASATIDILALAYDNGTPVLKAKQGPSYSTPFYVENITQETETLRIAGYDRSESDPASYLEIPVEFSTDGTNWSSLGTTGDTPLTKTLQPGDKVYLRATTNAWYEYQEEPYIDHGCTIGGVSKVGGNIMSLLYGSNFTGNETTFTNGSTHNFIMLFNYNETLVSASELILPATTLTQQCYQQMFYGCDSLTTAPAILPATTLANGCYGRMFERCTSLTTAPAILPATTLVSSCYSSMFRGCTTLTTAPALPATTLAEGCYSSMFNGCTSLTTAPAILPATTLADSCYLGMFEMCTSLTTAPALPATTLAQTCYGNMFSGCTSLTTAPALPATTLGYGCYNQMFSGCTSLTTAPELPATTLARQCYYAMFFKCTSLSTAPSILPATTLAQQCYYQMFQGCTALTSAPELPATTLTKQCYYLMFMNCTNLNHIKCLATNISASSCTAWVSGVASTGTFVKNPSTSTEDWGTGGSGIPEGWTVEDATV